MPPASACQPYSSMRTLAPSTVPIFSVKCLASRSANSSTGLTVPGERVDGVLLLRRW